MVVKVVLQSKEVASVQQHYQLGTQIGRCMNGEWTKINNDDLIDQNNNLRYITQQQRMDPSNPYKQAMMWTTITNKKLHTKALYENMTFMFQ